MTVHTEEIRRKLRELLDGEASLTEFQAWFHPATWELTDNDPTAEDLAGEIELRLAEFSRGDWTEKELRGLLAQLQVSVGGR